MKILLSVDDDDVARSVVGALDWSVRLSDRDEILLLHVAPRPLFRLASDARPRRTAESFLAAVARDLDRLEAPVRPILVHGEPAQEIARIADGENVELIVMGALGAKRDFLMGSVSQKVVSQAPTDVLVVRERPKPVAGFRALVAVDGSPASEAGVEAFARKLRADEASIRLVHVVEFLPALWLTGRSDKALWTTFASEARAILERSRELLHRRGLHAECELEKGAPAARILQVAESVASDVIVVGSRGHSSIRERVLGSITQRILRHAPCTVFCARGWATEKAELPSGWTSDEWEPEVGMA